MSLLEALILGLIQGLTEFLPISSSGHIELGKAIMEIPAEDATFTIVVHGATVLSIFFVFWRDIAGLFRGLFLFRWNEPTQYTIKIILSVIPVGIIGVFFREEVENLFTNNVLLVGCMLIITAILLGFTYYAKNTEKDLGYRSSFIIGLAQAVAVLPGISRSGATIATALLLGVKKEDAARFSFLMVIVPILGANLKDLMDGKIAAGSIQVLPLIVGFFTAFISGVIACRWMLNIVKRGKLIWFSIYCAIVGLISIVITWM